MNSNKKYVSRLSHFETKTLRLLGVGLLLLCKIRCFPGSEIFTGNGHACFQFLVTWHVPYCITRGTCHVDDKLLLIFLLPVWILYVPPGLTPTNSTFCPHSVFMCFVWISEQTVIISLYSINWLVFITETECVYCAVRAGSLSTIQVKFNKLTAGTTAHAVSCRSFKADTRVRSRFLHVRFAINKEALGQVFLRVFGFPFSIIPPLLDVALTGRTNGRSSGTFQRQRCFGNRGTLDIKVL
jgi:hypothetical protein